ncbi:hypothetical protein [Roseivivax isoporae]|uniref:Uncharacterized protein n=1 Tax=Roseivivax isoporae LMG 25204 TaxID=1449351 RepID=X7FCU9_9RHOB|nr:hypothetical protein [Roseivivax isoporae]ETX30640.1 hypothetical protein RISW2_07440 [Roseivivax isoporae LMG 25204]
MTSLFSTFRTRIEKRAAYRRTLRELRAAPLDVRLDLDIAGDEKAVARSAIYG